MELQQKIDGVAKAFEDFKSIHSKEIAEVKKFGEASAETKQQLERANAEIEKLQSEIKAVNAHLARAGSAGAGAGEQDEAKAAHKSEFIKFLRKGGNEHALAAAQQKALSTQSDPDGGYLVTPEMSSEIVKKIFESSPMRALSSVATISTDVFEIIEDLDEAASGWTSETGTRSETGTPQIKMIKIPVHELYAKPKATQKQLDDAFWNVEQWLAGKVSEKFSRDEATAFVSGNGVGKPRGILTYTNGTGFEQVEQINSGAAAAITADGLVDLVYALKGEYRAGSSFLMKRLTIRSVRKLKDSDGQYLWQPSLAAGSPDMLLGRPVLEAEDMPLEGAGNLVVALGDFKAAYQIVDRFGIRTLRDPYSSKPFVEFYTTKRVGGGVKNFEALKLLKCSA